MIHRPWGRKNIIYSRAFLLNSQIRSLGGTTYTLQFSSYLASLLLKPYAVIVYIYTYLTWLECFPTSPSSSLPSFAPRAPSPGTKFLAQRPQSLIANANALSRHLDCRLLASRALCQPSPRSGVTSPRVAGQTASTPTAMNMRQCGATCGVVYRHTIFRSASFLARRGCTSGLVMVNQRPWPRNAVGETVDTINVTGQNRCPAAWPSSVGIWKLGFWGKGLAV